MSRTGVEAKPAWREVPRAVRQATEEALSARVVRAERAYGGYSPTATFRLRLADGRRAFFKAPSGDTFSRDQLGREERVYSELGSTIGAWAPAYLASFEAEGWKVILLEDLGPATSPPWTARAAKGVMQAYAGFHAATLRHVGCLPAWLPRVTDWFGGEHLHLGNASVERLVNRLAGRGQEADGWLSRAQPRL